MGVALRELEDADDQTSDWRRVHKALLRRLAPAKKVTYGYFDKPTRTTVKWQDFAVEAEAELDASLKPKDSTMVSS